MRNVAIIGAGTVGTALGYLLNKKGYPVTGIASRTIRSARKAQRFIGSGIASTDLVRTARKADIIFITTTDKEIEHVCNTIAAGKGFGTGTSVFHTCGALPSAILMSAKKQGASIASLHPLQSLAGVKEAVENLPGSYFCIEGDRKALGVARKIIRMLKGREIFLRTEHKPLYHAGASVASNFLVAIVGFALELFEAAGIERNDSLKALLPLIKGTVKNIETMGVPAALTGPIARGDSGIVGDHLTVIAQHRKDLLKLYTELGRFTVKVAMAKKTLTESAAESILSALQKYEKGSRK